MRSSSIIYTDSWLFLLLCDLFCAGTFFIDVRALLWRKLLFKNFAWWAQIAQACLRKLEQVVPVFYGWLQFTQLAYPKNDVEPKDDVFETARYFALIATTTSAPTFVTWRSSHCSRGGRSATARSLRGRHYKEKFETLLWLFTQGDAVGVQR